MKAKNVDASAMFDQSVKKKAKYSCPDVPITTLALNVEKDFKTILDDDGEELLALDDEKFIVFDKQWLFDYDIKTWTHFAGILQSNWNLFELAESSILKNCGKSQINRKRFLVQVRKIFSIRFCRLFVGVQESVIAQTIKSCVTENSDDFCKGAPSNNFELLCQLYKGYYEEKAAKQVTRADRDWETYK